MRVTAIKQYNTKTTSTIIVSTDLRAPTKCKLVFGIQSANGGTLPVFHLTDDSANAVLGSEIDYLKVSTTRGNTFMPPHILLGNPRHHNWIDVTGWVLQLSNSELGYLVEGQPNLMHLEVRVR